MDFRIIENLFFIHAQFLFSASMIIVKYCPFTSTFGAASLFNSPGQSPGRAIVLPPASAFAAGLAKY